MENREPWKNDLVDVKERLRAGKLSDDDIRKLEGIVLSVEQSVAALRAAVVE